jgi:hypothetical protein
MKKSKEQYETLLEFVLQVNEGCEKQALVLEPKYEKAIVGYTDTGNGARFVYNKEKLIQEMMKDHGWDYEEASEWFSYNTLRAIPYMENQGLAPLFLETT